MFKDNEKALKEIQCYEYCVDNAEKHFDNNEFMDAAIYLENAARSLKELERMKKSERNDKVYLTGTILTSGNVNH